MNKVSTTKAVVYYDTPDPDDLLRHNGNLPTRVAFTLSRNTILTLREMATYWTRDDVANLRNIGDKSMALLDLELERAGLSWPENPPLSRVSVDDL